MKQYTYSSFEGYYYKYPIIGKETGWEYLIKIYPYGLNVTRYSEGCVITLYKKKWIFKKEVCYKHFNNDNGYIAISRMYYDDIKTDYTYTMIDMTKCIVDIYESSIRKEIKTNKQINKDFDMFKEWNGEV